MIHMVRPHDGEDLARADMTGADMVGTSYGGSQIWRDPDMAGANEEALIRLALQVYMLRKEYPAVESYVCRDLRFFQHTLYVHFGVLRTVKIVVSFWCAHKMGAHVCDARHCEAWSGSRQDFPLPDGISR